MARKSKNQLIKNGCDHLRMPLSLILLLCIVECYQHIIHNVQSIERIAMCFNSLLCISKKRDARDIMCTLETENTTKTHTELNQIGILGDQRINFRVVFLHQ